MLVANHAHEDEERAGVGDNAKMRELILYVAQVSEDDGPFGAVKLNKLLFYIDFLSYLYLGKAVTGELYKALPMGPVPVTIDSTLKAMQEEGDLIMRDNEYFGHLQRRPIWCRKAKLDRFTGEEIAFIDRLIRQFWGMSATELSEKSHEFIGWRIMDAGEIIPYHLALIGTRRELTEQEVRWGMELEATALERLNKHAG